MDSPADGTWKVDAWAKSTYFSGILLSPITATLNVINPNISFNAGYTSAFDSDTDLPVLTAETRYDDAFLENIKVQATLYRPDGTSVFIPMKVADPTTGYGAIGIYAAVLRDPRILNQEGDYQVVFTVDGTGGHQVLRENMEGAPFTSEVVHSFFRVFTDTFHYAPRRITGTFDYGDSMNGRLASPLDELRISVINEARDNSLGGSLQIPLLTSDGTHWSFEMGDIPAGKYHLTFKTKRSLAKAIDVDLTAGNLTLPPFSLLVGDVDDNNRIDVDDLTQVLFAFNTMIGDEGYTDTADLNSDGRVDVDDLTLVLFNFGLVGDD